MSEHNKIEWNTEQLWRGCVLAGIAHAIMVAKYPLIANEHSWDGLNYSVQDSEGQRGTISFCDGNCVGAFRNENSKRIEEALYAESYFEGAPREIIELANSEALQYLLEEVEGQTRPFITAAFWGKGELYTNDSFEEMVENGGNLLERQALDIDKAIKAWQEAYDMDEEQVQLLKLIYERKLYNFDNSITLSEEEISMLGTADEEGLEESRISFEEMQIYWG